MTKDCSLDYKFCINENWKLRTLSEHVVYINCSECQNKNQFVYTTCSERALFMYWTCNSMNNLLSYCGLVDAKIRASDIDLPVSNQLNELKFIPFFCDSVSLSCKSFRVPVQLESPFSKEQKEELFHFISIFLSSAGKVRGRFGLAPKG